MLSEAEASIELYSDPSASASDSNILGYIISLQSSPCLLLLV